MNFIVKNKLSDHFKAYDIDTGIEIFYVSLIKHLK